MTVGEELPWPSAGGEMGGGEGGGLDEQFEDSLGDFDEAVSGGTSGGGGAGKEEIEILDPMGGGGAPSDGPLFEEGDLGGGGDGDSQENEAVAQRAASGSSSSSSSSGGEGGQQGGEGGESGEQEGSEQQSQSKSSSSSGGGSGGGANAESGSRDAGSIATTGGSDQAESDIVPIPQDIGDGRNDDIVLRQIRAAAMNEKDPVLREKLWDEYRRIRGSRN